LTSTPRASSHAIRQRRCDGRNGLMELTIGLGGPVEEGVNRRRCGLRK
jgi:hypothetical protein